VSESSPRRRRWLTVAAVLAAVFTLLFACALWYTTTASFQAFARRRLIRELERVTGGRAEIGSFHIVPFHEQIEVRDITVHGTEARSDAPLLHADHIYARMKVVSFLRTEFTFHTLELDHPVIHVEVAEDGITNIPSPAARQASTINPIEQLFALSIDHLIIRDGQLQLADRNLPLDASVEGVGLRMDYSYLRGRYESHLSVGKVDMTLDGMRPFSWMTSLDFALGATFVDIEQMKWTSGRSHVEGSGRVSDFRNPHVDGSYNAHLDFAELGAILRRTDLRAGAADLRGSGRWTLNAFSTAGSFNLDDLDWQNDQFALKKASARSDYSLTDEQIKLAKLQGRLLGGSFSGDAQVDNWLHFVPAPRTAEEKRQGKKFREDLAVISAAPPRTSKPLGVQTGAVHLRLRDVSDREVAVAFDVPAHPLGRFHPVGVASGSLDLTWRGSPEDAELAFALDSKPTAGSPGDLPVTARAQGRYRMSQDILELTQFNASTTASRIEASGTLSTASALHVAVSTLNLEEWRPLVLALGGPANLPFRVDGNATFSGVVSGTFTSPTLAGALAAQDFEFTVPASSRTPAQPVHWDSLAASLQFSSHNLSLHDGSLRRGETSADFDASADLRHGQFTDDCAYTARVNLHNVDVASTAALAGFDYPVSGTADVALQIAGTRANPQVQGHIHAAHASAYQETIDGFDADLQIYGGDTALTAIHFIHQGAVVNGKADYTPATRGFGLDLTGTNFDLAQIRQIHLDRLPTEGHADFHLQGSGTLDAPQLDASVHVRDLTLDHELAGDLYFEAVTRDGALRLSGHSALPHGTLLVEGDVNLHGDFPATVTARFDHIDLDALWRGYLGPQLTGHSAVAGTVTMKGPLRYPRQWTLDGDLNNVSVEVEHARVNNDGPVRFTYAQQTVHIQPLHMVGDGTDLTGQGSIGFGGSRGLDLAAEGRIDMKVLASFDPDLTASGKAAVSLTVGGTLEHMQPQGTIRVEGGTANYAGLPSGLSEIAGEVTFARNRFFIQNLTAKTGGGTLDLKGEATTYNHQLNFTLTAIGKEVRLRYPPGVSSTANEELHWVGNLASSTVTGEIYVTKLAVTPGFDFGSYLERSRAVGAITPASSPLYNVKLDVAVRTAPELQMKTAVARLSGDADLRVRGSLARPSVLGRADILEGDATFNGIKFRLERGDITFANPVAIEPQVNLQATTHVRNYDLDVTVTGTPDRLAVNYRSEPPLPKSDIIALLALGRTSEESAQLQQQGGQTPFTDEASALIINQAINSTVSSRLQKVFGVSRIKIDPQGLTTETNPTARGPQVTIEQQFANNISLTYSTNVSQSTEQIIQGEYFFTRDISAVALRDWNGVVSVDLRIRRRKK